MNGPVTSEYIRGRLVESLELDLVGPDNTHAFAHELLPDSPTRWYLTGFLIPVDAPEEQRYDESSNDEADAGGEDGGATDDAGPLDPAATKSYLPSSMGLSLLVKETTTKLEVAVEWGDYVRDDPRHVDAQEAPTQTSKLTEGEKRPKFRRGFRREPHVETVSINLGSIGNEVADFAVPNSNGLELAVTLKGVLSLSLLPAGTKSVSVFLVNKRKPDDEDYYRSFVFQAKLVAECEEGFASRPDPRGLGQASGIDEWDESVGNLHYRDVYEFAVGHGVATLADEAESGVCRKISTTWIPQAEVERVSSNERINCELRIEELALLRDGAEAATKLSPLIEQYSQWICIQERKKLGLSSDNQITIDELLSHAKIAADRIRAGVEQLNHPVVLEAFRIANRAMAAAAKQRQLIQAQGDATKVATPKWHPFQLAFILLTLRGIVDPSHTDRECVDLLFFPTGGGKTEAYLGLAAFTLALRRLRNPGIRSAGVTVLMRYTLRLLTLDQLGRAAALICALELERDRNSALGEWPFEIGLWVGSAATPNIMGHKGYDGPGKERSARAKTIAYRGDDKRPAPIPIEECPWCGAKFTRDSFFLTPNPDKPTNLTVKCVNYKCEFSKDRSLPILGVDEAIYRRLPGFLIATVDKFASLPWTGPTGSLFGFVDRYDEHGFYGPCDPGRGNELGKNLPPPELIVQDELHLISGPLGTVAGIYETVIDELSSRTVGSAKIRPKIIASTATVRRADSQIRALFGRQRTSIFPAPGPSRTDSFFAYTQPSSETPARLYVGVAAQGRSLKVIMLRTALALMSAAQAFYEQQGNKKNRTNPVDPYMTALCYFNSLRELGGSRRIFEDEVRSKLETYFRRARLDPKDDTFVARRMRYDVCELTSRVSTNDVANVKRRLTQPFHEMESIDVALATNMISVGLDIARLGLMVVNGQPKTSAEYIQASSRVGRLPDRPGLVVTLFNVHRPRDRSHFERFAMYHSTFYRSVEATSVTPFSPRALDRALAAALVALCRHTIAQMTPALGAMQISTFRAHLSGAAQCFAARARDHKQYTAAEGQALYDHVLARCNELLDDWLKIQQEFESKSTRLVYNPSEAPGPQRLLYEPLNRELTTIEPIRRRFRANRSMRDVETSVELETVNLHEWGTE
jgi:helicase-like protein